MDGAEGNVGDILPFTSDAKSQSFANKFKQPSTFNDDNFKDFIAGDTRVEENPYLASFHTIFVRYHNLMVDGLRKQRPGKPFRYKLQLCICGTPGSGVLKVLDSTVLTQQKKVFHSDLNYRVIEMIRHDNHALY